MRYPRTMRFGLIVSLFCSAAGAQVERISKPINMARRTVLTGHVPARMRAASDLGPLQPDTPMVGLILHLGRSSGQDAGVKRLLSEQQDKTSLNFHRWLQPEEYADQFGLGKSDFGKLTAWLEGAGFTIDYQARSRTYIVFHGTASQVERTFQPDVRRFRLDGQEHYGPSADPSIPEALSGIVIRIGGLDDIPATNDLAAIDPKLTAASGNHYLAPDDLATIYNIKPLYDAGIDGAGQKIAIVGQSSINLADTQAFRAKFNLAASDPQTVIPTGLADPGQTSARNEAYLDLQWAGAVARGAQLIYVYTRSAYSALQYVVDQNLAPVVSASFSTGCEAQSTGSFQTFQYMAQQANAQGITWVNSSGDAGGAGCDSNGAASAQNGKGARFPAAIPEVTAVGGTQFNDGGGTYWRTTNDLNSASALSYIPEVPWNSSTLRNAALAGGGGASFYFAKPYWQTGPGVPNDGVRDVPDVSLSASPDHVGYYVATGGSSGYFGGTSASAPVFAGILALLNHYQVANGGKAGLGNVNPMLYSLAQTNPLVFHDVMNGDIYVPCIAGSPDCDNGSFGFSAGAGYDLATGLGSPDVANLVRQWDPSRFTNSALIITIDPHPVYEVNGKWPYTISIAEQAGVGTTLTDLVIDGTSYANQLGSYFGSATIAPRGSVSVNLQSSGLTPPLTRKFSISGMDANGRQWTQEFSVLFNGPAPAPVIAGVSNAASGQQVFAPGMILSVYGTNLTGRQTPQLAAAVPLLTFFGNTTASINGIAAPFYYVSPNQINVQIPYTVSPGTARLSIFNELATGTFTFTVQPTAPGIFTDGAGNTVPFASAGRGKTVTLFITGEGAVTPTLATGASPAAGTSASKLPVPDQPVSMTIGGVPATVVFAGIPSGLVGVTQVNFTVPANAPLGVQPVVVTVGSASSQSAKITVTQ